MNGPVIRSGIVWVVVILLVAGLVLGLVLASDSFLSPMTYAHAERYRSETAFTQAQNDLALERERAAQQREADRHAAEMARLAQRQALRERRAQIWNEILVQLGTVFVLAMAAGIVIVAVAVGLRLLLSLGQASPQVARPAQQLALQQRVSQHQPIRQRAQGQRRPAPRGKAASPPPAPAGSQTGGGPAAPGPMNGGAAHKAAPSGNGPAPAPAGRVSLKQAELVPNRLHAADGKHDAASAYTYALREKDLA